MSEWLFVGDRVPPMDGTKILVFTVHGEIELSDWYVIPRHHYEHVEHNLYRKIDEEPYDGWNSNTFNWWMPLPGAPVQPEHTPSEGK